MANVLIINDPVQMLIDVFKDLHPNKSCEIIYKPDFDEPDAMGYTIFPDDGSTPQIVLDTKLTLEDMINTLAEEFAHVVVGIEHDHDEVFESEFMRLGAEVQKRWTESKEAKTWQQ